MKSLIAFLKTTIVGGALYLLPIVIILVVLGKVHVVTVQLLAPVTQELQLHDLGGIHVARLIAIAAIVLACFVAGLYARTNIAQQFVGWLERAILSNLPGYSMVSALGEQATGHRRDGVELHSVLVRIEDAWQLAMYVEEIDAEHVTVFVPGAPDPNSGSVYVLTKDRLKEVDISTRDAMKCIKGGGIGTRALLSGKLYLPRPELGKLDIMA